MKQRVQRPTLDTASSVTFAAKDSELSKKQEKDAPERGLRDGRVQAAAGGGPGMFFLAFFVCFTFTQCFSRMKRYCGAIHLMLSLCFSETWCETSE